MKVVIVGGVAGGASAAARLRRLDEEVEIVMLERGDYVSFANCGLPYHIGGDIKKRGDLLIATPEHFREQFNIDVRTGHEATTIDRAGKSVRVRERASGREYDQPYDKLILSQGAAPLRPPLPGIDHERVLVLRDISDMDTIERVVSADAGHAVVIGAGYIGLEMTEALVQRGLEVDLVEMQDRVLPILDPEMVCELQNHLEEKGVRVHLGAGVKSFAEAGGGRVAVELGGGGTLTADLALLAVGVRPETGLAAAAGLELGTSGGVRVDGRMLTSDPDIYAVGDMVEVEETVTGERVNIPLAGPANRQGRIAADHLGGRKSSYTTTQGTAIVKVFGQTAAITGASEQTLRPLGRAYEKIHIHPFGHASYYPGTGHMHLKMLFDPEDGKVLGAQIVGRDGVDKRIDVFAVAIRAGLTVHDLEQQELAYAPPYGSAKDAVNMAGFVGANVMDGIVRFWYAEDHPEKTAAGTVLDVRTPKEYKQGHVSGAVLVPVDEVRSRIEEIRKLPEPFYIYCYTGIRSYMAYRILKAAGFSDIYNLSGGWRTYNCVHRMRLEDGQLSARYTE
ncbi:MAG: FAD-dependent oxidoreductase [Actinobacteria bacterium]|nr:FAD-dependent oxidoreductase [Actinomycetota bacterium]